MKNPVAKILFYVFYFVLQFVMFATLEGAHYTGILSFKIAAIVLIAVLAAEAWSNISRRFLKVLFVALPFFAYWIFSFYFSGILRLGGTFYDLGFVYFLTAFTAFGFYAFKKIVQKKWRLRYYYFSLILLLPLLAFIELPFNMINQLRGKAQLDLTNKDFKTAYSELFKNIRENYYYFDLKDAELREIDGFLKTEEKWDSTRFDLEMKRLCFRLQDSHLRYNKPDDNRTKREAIGIWFSTINGLQFVSSVSKKGVSFKNGIRRGAVLTEINRLPVETAVKAYYESYKVDVPQQSLSEFVFKTMLYDLDSLNLTFKTPENSEITVHYADEERKKNQQKEILKYDSREVEARILSGNIGYLHFDKWPFDPLFITKFDRALEKVWNTRGLILDLRGNTGGFGGLLPFITGRFTESEFMLAEFIDKERNDVLKISVKPRSPVYAKKVIVLINEMSTSASGFFILAAKQLPRMEVIGKPSRGVVSYPTKVAYFPQGRSMILYNGGISFKNTADNHRQLNPDILIPYDLGAIREGLDYELEFARKRF